MDRRRRSFNGIAGGFLVLIVLMVVLVAANGLRRTSHIALPSPSASASPSGSGAGEDVDAVIRLEVTPETVQAVVETLRRPERYTRRITVERLWSGGSGTRSITASVSGKVTRTDGTEPDGRVRHSITDGETTYIWYDAEETYFSGAAGDISADQEQSIPTYENILDLNQTGIVQADYRIFSGEECIFVETAADELGYVQRYWVSVGSGLLIGAERLQKGETVYRMAAQPVSETLPTAADFVLPDGTIPDGVKSLSPN